MASTTIEKIKVDTLTKYGFQVGTEYINFSKLFTDQAKVVPGAEFEAEFYVADSGKRYLNKILASVAAVPVVKEQKAIVVPAKKEYKAKADTSMTKEDWNAKDRRISRQGLIQASLIALAPVVALDVLFTEAAKLAEQGLEFVNR